MLSSLNSFLASTVSVPDSGMTSVLVTTGIVSLALFARFLSNRKK